MKTVFQNLNKTGCKKCENELLNIKEEIDAAFAKGELDEPRKTMLEKKVSEYIDKTKQKASERIM